MPTTTASLPLRRHEATLAPASKAPGTELTRLKLTLLSDSDLTTPTLIRDIVETHGSHGGTIALVDIDPMRRSQTAHQIWRLLAACRAKNWVVVATSERRRALPGSDYVVNCVDQDPAGQPSVALAARLHNRTAGSSRRPKGTAFRFPKESSALTMSSDARRDCCELCPEAIMLDWHLPAV